MHVALSVLNEVLLIFWVLLTIMVYYRKSHGKCKVCKICRPRHWFRCVICGRWMGMHCNPKQVWDTSLGLEDERRFDQDEVSLHCYIWTSNNDRSERADLCVFCCESQLLPSTFPAHIKRRILKFVSWGSRWWGRAQLQLEILYVRMVSS